MKNQAIKTCLSTTCLERFSVCCGAISKRAPGKYTQNFVCSTCEKPFVGGKCGAEDGKSFFDYSLKEKKEIVEKAAKESNWMQRETMAKVSPSSTKEWEKIVRRYFPLEALADGLVQDHGDYKQAKRQAETFLNTFIKLGQSFLSQQREELVESIRKEEEKWKSAYPKSVWPDPPEDKRPKDAAAAWLLREYIPRIFESIIDALASKEGKA